MAMLKIKIYDNGGKTVDRYTMIMPDGEAWGFSESPYHPQGFGQYAGNLSELKSFSHLGKPVGILDLSEQAGKFVDEIATADGDTYIVSKTSSRSSRKVTAKKSKSQSRKRMSSPTSIRGMRG